MGSEMCIRDRYGTGLIWVGMTIATALFSESGKTNQDAARASIAMIFLFGATYSIGLTPLQALYPVEVLSFEMRAKGMAFSSLAVNAGGMLGQFAWPISLQKIGWKTYIIFIVWNFVQGTVFYFFMPESKLKPMDYYIVSVILTVSQPRTALSRSSTASSRPRTPSRPLSSPTRSRLPTTVPSWRRMMFKS